MSLQGFPENLILGGESIPRGEWNLCSARSEMKTFLCFYYCKQSPSSQWRHLRVHLRLPPRRRGPTEKTPQGGGGVNHRLGGADRTGGNDGQRRNTCCYWELNPSYRWQARVSVEAHNRWHLTPLNSPSADIPLVSASRPIRIDCSAASLFHGQVIAGSSSSSTLMMLRIELTQLSEIPVRRPSSWCWPLIRGRKHSKYGKKIKKK